jgi:hypothetical protein
VYIFITMKRFQIHLAEPQFAALKGLADQTGLTMAELIRRAVDLFLKLEKKP